jgi:hypothetical protein
MLSVAIDVGDRGVLETARVTGLDGCLGLPFLADA